MLFCWAGDYARVKTPARTLIATARITVVLIKYCFIFVFYKTCL